MNEFVTYAQNFEDVILWRALKNVTNGFYVDVGANSPLADSVTRAFYERGWHGINIEADVEWMPQLQSERPRDINIHAFASNRSGLTAFFHIPKDPGLSTFDPSIAENHRAAGYELEKRVVPTVTLNEVLDLHRVETMHFLKIDVEGAEKVVIEGIDLAKHRPWIILVESTLPNSQTPSHESFENLLSGAGYRFCYFDGLNRFYVCHERFDTLAALVALPPNPFDRYIRVEEVNLRQHFEDALRQIQERDQKANEGAADYRLLIEERDQLKEIAIASGASRKKDVALAEMEQVGTKLDQYEEVFRQQQAERNARTAFVDQLNALCRKHLNQRDRSDSSKKIRVFYQAIYDGVTAAYQKHFGKKRLRLNEPEPRYNFFKRTLQSVFRKQGSVNKGLISSFRNQIAWNKEVVARLDTMEGFFLEFSEMLSGFSLAQSDSQRITKDGIALAQPKDAAPVDNKDIEGTSRLSARARAIYKSLEKSITSR